ncbi:diacylglycerol/lipid kinase family protein [Lactococcus insecticola]|uniref:Transcriptional regulator n=1 Tax=Pseudolactococcus insecticola TaxID=2709158 RepID=A0A6A0B7E8_9LACT|nr:YegS/Rv2252/BmrU family lipid kinase [Lactococcus insecticola]GFH41359.1 transcriptional regulator [Lactococcus insecticola]
MIYYILANPHAGHGHGKVVTHTLTDYLSQKNIPFHLFETQQPLDEAPLIAKILTLKTGADRLLIIGGDGTISLSLNALPADEVFSYIPAGSGNDFARGLGISRQESATLATFDAIHSGQAQEIYVISYSSDKLSGIATNNIGIGLDAAIVDAANKSRLKAVLNRFKLGQLSYLISALHVLFTKKAFAIQANGRRFDKAFIFTVTKHPYFGGGIPLAPDASLKTPELHLVTISRFNLFKTFLLIPKLLKGTHFENDHVDLLINKHFTLTATSTQPVQIDGEIKTFLAGQTLEISTEKRTIIY